MELEGITCFQEACVPPGAEGALKARAKLASKELTLGPSIQAGTKAANGIGTVADPGQVYETDPP